MSIESVIYGDLPGAVFEFRFYHGNPYHCCALKATFAFDAGGELELLEEQPCLLYTSPSPRDGLLSRMPSSA